MAYIDNTDTKKEMNDAMRGNAVSNIAPTKINDSVQPVININPKDYRRINILKTAATETTIYTTPTDKDFYLHGTYISAASGAAGNNAARISVIIDGDTAATIINVVNMRLTAAIDGQNGVSNQDFVKPIKLARNSAITSSKSGTLTAAQYTIIGYTVEL